MNPRSLLLIITAFSGWSVAALLNGQSEPESPAPPTVRVLVAATDLERGAELTDETVRFVERPLDAVSDDAVISFGQWDRLALTHPVLAMDVIHQSRLVRKRIADRDIPDGKRLVSFNVETGDWIDQLRPGDSVDLLVTFEQLRGHNEVGPLTRTLLARAELYAVTNQVDDDNDNRPGVCRRIVHLLGTAEQVDAIRLAESRGDLTPWARTPGCGGGEGGLDQRTIDALEAALPEVPPAPEGDLPVQPTRTVTVSSGVPPLQTESARPVEPDGVSTD